MKTKLLIISALILAGAMQVFASPFDELKSYCKEKDYTAARNIITAAIAEKPKNSDVYLLAGDVYYELALTDSAMIMYKKANELESDNNLIRRKLARTYSDLGKHNEALELINKAIKSDKKDVLNYLSLGQAYLKQGELSKADLEIRKAQKMDEKLPQGWVALGDLYYGQRVFALAIDNYKKALELDEANIDARINLATSYYNLARQEEDKDLKNEYYSQSLNQWEIVANKDPKNAKAFWEAGKIYYYAELFENAAKYLNKYIQLRPDHSLARYYLVESLYKINACDLLVENAPIVAKEIDSVKIRVQLWAAECLYKTQKFTDAINAYNAVGCQTQLTAEQYENIANSYLLSGDTLKAIQAFREVIKIDKNQPLGLMRYGTLAYVMKDYNSAIEYLKIRDEVVKDTLSDKMKYYLGLSYIFAEKYQEAIPVFEHITKEDPSNYFAYLYMSDAYIKSGEKEKAKQVLVNLINILTPKAKENENAITGAYSKLNNIFLQDKNFKEMGKYSKAWTEALPNSASAFFFYGLSFHGSGDAPNACRNYKKVVALDPNSELAKNARKFISDLKCNE